MCDEHGTGMEDPLEVHRFIAAKKPFFRPGERARWPLAAFVSKPPLEARGGTPEPAGVKPTLHGRTGGRAPRDLGNGALRLKFLGPLGLRLVEPYGSESEPSLFEGLCRADGSFGVFPRSNG